MPLYDIDAEDYKLLRIKILSYHVKTYDHFQKLEKFPLRQ